MIEQHNILELLSKGGESTYHSAILTCYTFDPIFFSTYYLPILRNRGVSNILVYMDAIQYDIMMQQVLSFQGYLIGFSLVRMNTRNGSGVFHSKVSILIGENQGLIFVGSGNLTFSGMSLNDEVWGTFELTEKDIRFAPLFAQVWSYLCSFELIKLAHEQVGWMVENAKWLQDVKQENSTSCITEDNTEVIFLTQDLDKSLYDQLIDYLSISQVNEMTVVSPFYDENGYGISRFIDDLKPKLLNLVVEIDNGRVPHSINNKETKLRLNIYKWDRSYDNARKLHAKIFQFTTTRGTYLLVGSANATRNAMGLNHSGYNEEACILFYDANGKNFLKEMRITLNPSEMISLVEIKNCIKSPLASKPITNFEVHILDAEILDEKLLMKVDNPGKDYMVTLTNGCGREITYKFANILSIDNLDFVPRYIYITKGGEKKSNNYLVYKEEEILRCNPNLKNAKLKNLIDKVYYWDDNIASILEFISFDDTPNTVRNEIISHENKNQVEKANTKVSSDRFEHLSVRAKSDIMSSSNIMIADIFNAIFNNDPAASGLTGTSEKEEDNAGNPDGSSRITKNENFDEQRKKSIINVSYYLRKMVDKHYNEIMPNPNDLIRTKPYLYATLNDYAAVSISNHLILFSQSHNVTYKYKELKNLFISIMEKISLLFRDGFEYEDGKSVKKMREMLLQFVTSAILLFSHFSWGKEKQIDVYLVLLNTLDLLKYLHDDQSINEDVYHTINSIMVNLFKDAERNELGIDNSSLAIVKRILDIFKEFNSKSKENKRKAITEIDQGKVTIIHTMVYGYVSFDKYNKNKRGYYQFICYRPAFAERELPDYATILNIQHVCSL